MGGFSRTATVLVVAAAGSALVGCGGRAEPRSLPPQTLVEESADAEPAPPPPEPITEERKPETLIVLEDAEPVAASQTLVEAAAAERRRRAAVSGSTLKLTDKNLDRYAVGDLTTSDPDPLPMREIRIEGSPAAAPAPAAQLPTAPTPVESASTEPTAVPAVAVAPEAAEAALLAASETGTNEGYWRNRVLDIRLRWRAAQDSIGELESKVAELRNQFYTTDDPFYRNSQIKPAWDRALENLETARRDVTRYQAELQSVLEEGHRDGALPGWLREGIEHEPDRTATEEDRIDPDRYSVEPTIYEPNGSR